MIKKKIFFIFLIIYNYCYISKDEENQIEKSEKTKDIISNLIILEFVEYFMEKVLKTKNINIIKETFFQENLNTLSKINGLKQISKYLLNVEIIDNNEIFLKKIQETNVSMFREEPKTQSFHIAILKEQFYQKKNIIKNTLNNKRINSLLFYLYEIFEKIFPQDKNINNYNILKQCFVFELSLHINNENIFEDNMKDFYEQYLKFFKNIMILEKIKIESIVNFFKKNSFTNIFDKIINNIQFQNEHNKNNDFIQEKGIFIFLHLMNDWNNYNKSIEKQDEININNFFHIIKEHEIFEKLKKNQLYILKIFNIYLKSINSSSSTSEENLTDLNTLMDLLNQEKQSLKQLDKDKTIKESIKKLNEFNKNKQSQQTKNKIQNKEFKQKEATISELLNNFNLYTTEQKQKNIDSVFFITIIFCFTILIFYLQIETSPVKNYDYAINLENFNYLKENLQSL